MHRSNRSGPRDESPFAPSAERWTGCVTILGAMAGLGLLASIMLSVPAARAADAADAQALMTTTSERMLRTLRSKHAEVKGNARRLFEVVDEVLIPHIDFDRASRLVLAQSWRQATPEQRRRFVEEFRSFLIRFYVTALAEYTKDKDIPDDLMTFLPVKAKEGAKQLTVRSRVHQPNGGDIAVHYRLFADGGQWKIVDVSVAGVSLATNYRTSFAREIKEKGLDGLIDTLAEKNREFAF